MEKVELYVIRHGKTMFNALQRAQGWCDTPLTEKGAEMIHYLGLGLKETDFVEAVSSDSGRAIETMRIILGEHPKGSKISYSLDNRIREWCWGSLEGGYDSEMWGVLPRVLNFKDSEEMWETNISFGKIAEAVKDADFTIAFLLNLIDANQPVRVDLQNGSVTRLTYDENGNFAIEEVGSTTFIKEGQKISKNLLA